MRTLIVDDMKEVYDKISRNLEGDYAPTLDEALKRINSGDYERVITDYHLGDESPQGGLEVAKAAKEKGLAVILMSRENHRDEARELGVDFKFKKELF
ncbi:MAG: response regulator [Candidatus Pacearchaeota archaeon]